MNFLLLEEVVIFMIHWNWTTLRPITIIDDDDDDDDDDNFI